MLSYCVSKAGLEMLTKCMALEYASKGMRVNAVAAGYAETNLLSYNGVGTFEFRAFKKQVEEHCPLKRLANPEEVAKAIIFLASDRAKHITGHIMRVDGAHSIGTPSFVHWEPEHMQGRFEPKRPGFFTRLFNGLSENFSKMMSTEESRLRNNYYKSSWTTQMNDAHVKVTD